jgi:predicted transcriptional regulator
LLEKLPPRERQLLETLYAHGPCTAARLEELVPDPPSNSAIRVMLRRLEKKGYVVHDLVEQSFVYRPAVPERKVRQSALRQVIDTFFNGSPVSAASAMLGLSERVDPKELDELERMIARVREEKAR